MTRAKRDPADMSLTEYRSACDQLGLSITGAGRFFKINPRTSSRYADGDSKIPRGIAYALRLMVRFNVQPVQLDATFK